MSAVVEFGFNASTVFSGVAKMDSVLGGLDTKQGQRAKRMAADGRMQLALIEAQISGNKKEAASIQNRIALMERMRTIQQQTNVSQREAYTLAQRSAGLATKGGGGRGFGVGQAAMQMQDIAVQMQMGTKMSTIMAQQGSQMLSMFGPGGMILGGLVAVGGMFYTMQQKGIEALQALKKEGEGFDQSLRHLKVGGIMEMIDGMEQMKAKAASLSADAASRTGTGMFEATARFLSPTTYDASGKGTNTYDERRNVAADLAAKNEQGRKDLMEQIVKTAAEELRIAQMRAAGRDQEADKLEREAALRRELAKLDAAPAEIRGKLQDNAKAKSAAEQQKADKAAAKERAAEIAKVAQSQAALDDQKKQAAMDQMTLAQRIAIMSVDAQKALAEENRLKGAAKLDAQAILDAESKRVAIQAQILSSQKQLANEKKREAEEAKRVAEANAEAAKQAAAAAQAQRGTVLNTALEYQMLQAKARGNQKEMERIEYAQRVLERAARLEQQNGLDKKAALALAIKMTDLEDRGNGKRTRIRGVQTAPGDANDRYGLSGRASGTSMSGRTGPLSTGGPLTRNGGITGFWNRQLGNTGQLGTNPSGFAKDNVFSPSLDATLQANVAAQNNQSAASSPLVDSFLDKLMSRLPPALANALLGNP